jgi:hypothetical protein
MLVPVTWATTKPVSVKPTLEYSYTVPGVWLYFNPLATRPINAASLMPICGSTHELSSVSPPDMLSSMRREGGSHGSSGAPVARKSGKNLVIGSSSESSPRSRAMSTAAAVKLLDIEAMGKAVSALGTVPTSLARPNPALCVRPSAVTMP